MKHAATAAAIALTLGLTGCYAQPTSGPDLNPPTTASDPKTPTVTTPEYAALGQPWAVNYSDGTAVSIIVTAKYTTTPPEEYLEGTGWVVVTVKETATKGSVLVSPIDWVLRDQAGEAYEPEWAGTLISAGELVEGETATGTIIFEAPRGDTTLIHSETFDRVAAWKFTL